MEIVRDDEALFMKGRLSEVLSAQEEKVRKDVEGYDANRLLNTPEADLVDYFAKSAAIEPVELQQEGISADQAETSIDGRRLRDAYFDRGYGPRTVPGTKFSFFVPFEGEPALLGLQPNTWTSNPPCGAVRGQELILSFSAREPDGARIKAQFEAQLQSIESYLRHSTNMVREHNEKVRKIASQAVQARRERLLAAQKTSAAIGYPMRRRPGSTGTYSAPSVRRKVRPEMPPATSAPFEPEPVLPDEEYEHILGVMRNMTVVLERSPSAFTTMGEEDLRQHFLVQLNGHYEGTATGETFNAGGKTDILIRHEDKNLFIAECKFWKGPAKFKEAIDQLLSYTCWRDTKTAVVVFSRDTALTTVMTKIPDVLKAHPNFKRSLPTKQETEHRAVLHHNGDPSRELIVTVLVFDVPAPGAT